ncbi:X8 domain [Dillenia turbinata]|uniref:X8 domain n=1 Tax=Dillenia turbinata TaxID=194707 RepID=A0AAN8VEC3_9MAGN
MLKDNNEVKTWCIAKPSSNETALSNNLQYACDNEMVDCGILEEGNACFCPNTLINHASIAMNLYYQANGHNYWDCDFMKSGLITISDPSYGDCKY